MEPNVIKGLLKSWKRKTKRKTELMYDALFDDHLSMPSSETLSTLSSSSDTFPSIILSSSP